jgi:Mg/Co/Ni transporter MgtE
VNGVDHALLLGWFRREPAECVRLLQYLTPDENGAFLAALDDNDLGELFRFASVWWLKRTMTQYPDVAWDQAAEQAGTDPNALRLLRLLDRAERDRLLQNTTRRRHARIMRALALPRDQVVAVANDRIPVAHLEEPVGVVVQRLRGEDPRGGFLYLISDAGRYLGQVAISSLIDACPTAEVSELPRQRFEPVPAGMQLADAQRRNDWRSSDTLPVVDGEGLLLGALRFASLVRAIELARGEAPTVLPSVPSLLMGSWLDVLAALFSRGGRRRGI